jgi:hypothetical protein
MTEAMQNVSKITSDNYVIIRGLSCIVRMFVVSQLAS